MMILGDLKSLDSYLADHSYVDGYVPSQSDTSHFEAVTKPPTNATPHVLRWYNHIKSFGNEMKNFPGERKAAGETAKLKQEAPKPAAKDDDDDFDLFGSDDEFATKNIRTNYGSQAAATVTATVAALVKSSTARWSQPSEHVKPPFWNEEAAKIREDRLKEYAAKKAKKPALIAKSSIILDVKPWDDETDMKLMEEKVRSIVKDGLVWGASKLVPLAFGIKKLQIICVVEDDKISVDVLTEDIEQFEDLVQSVDVAAFNKI